MNFVTPNSMFARVLQWHWVQEYNKHHRPAGSPDSSGGEFAPKEGGDSSGAKPKPLTVHIPLPHGEFTQVTQPESGSRMAVIRVKKISEAIRLILQGKAVELTSVHKVYTLLHRLADMAQDAKKKGKDAPNYDLCKVSVKGTNLFCAARLITHAHPEGIVRIAMPQFSGIPVPGTPASRLPKDKKGAVDAGPEFLDHLQRRGIRFATTVVPAAQIRASQAQLVGPHVAELMVRMEKGEKKPKTIFVSRDNYIVDGHHNWAAQVGLDAENGTLGHHMTRVVKIDAPISEILHISKRWAKRFGIKPADVSGKRK